MTGLPRQAVVEVEEQLVIVDRIHRHDLVEVVRPLGDLQEDHLIPGEEHQGGPLPIPVRSDDTCHADHSLGSDSILSIAINQWHVVGWDTLFFPHRRYVVSDLNCSRD